MSEIVIPERNGYEDDFCKEVCFETEDSSTNSTDTEEYLDLADLNDFMDCSAAPVWQTDKQRNIEKLAENSADAISFREICFSRGGLLNGIQLLCFLLIQLHFVIKVTF